MLGFLMEENPELQLPNLSEIKEQFKDRYEFTDSQILFAFYFSLTRNGMFSVRKAGYHCSTAGSESTAANRLKKLPKIQDLVAYFDRTVRLPQV